MKPLAIATLLAALLAGCGTAPQQEVLCNKPETINVPVYTKPPAPPVINKPHLPIQDVPDSYLDDPTKNDIVVKALSASVTALVGYAKQLSTALDAYKSRD